MYRKNANYNELTLKNANSQKCVSMYRKNDDFNLVFFFFFCSLSLLTVFINYNELIHDGFGFKTIFVPHSLYVRVVQN